MPTALTSIDAQALLNAQARAWNTNPAGIAATYAPTGSLVSPDGHVCDGRAVIEAAFVMLFGGPATPGMPPAWAGLFADTTTD
ncbi:hypothetical protein LQ327_00030 [Actinomycetospora endophytica]|uniref:SnoaL-like protein n=1 Tax=Actinomycetospora endophytica TaxID=2291215 RepID=A0ABS8P120_9PSEU|nr:hypothetical protein [Actinomycetospora endophytica]MCD2191779.1 hypothetical protein [Actinomycetospora endophytica]